MAAKARSIDEYLASLDAEKRRTLEALRRVIRAAAPKADECISYDLPGFRLDGRLLVSFGAWANHCALYPGDAPIRAHAEELAAYDTSKGTIRFPIDRPLSAALVRRLVRFRIAQLTVRKPARKSGG